MDGTQRWWALTPVEIKYELTHMSLAYILEISLNSAAPDQTPQNAASDQVLHCLLTECSIKIWIKLYKKIPPNNPRRWMDWSNSYGSEIPLGWNGLMWKLKIAQTEYIASLKIAVVIFCIFHAVVKPLRHEYLQILFTWCPEAHQTLLELFFYEKTDVYPLLMSKAWVIKYNFKKKH